jgi:hypothetical protein
VATDSNFAAVDRLEVALARLASAVAGRTRSGRTHLDADEEVGTAATDDAIGFNPMPLLRALDEAGARVVVIGQVAGIMHGSSELTGDLDLLWDGGCSQVVNLAAAFAQVHAELSDEDDRLLGEGADPFSLPKILFRTATASGDCCTPALQWGQLPVQDFITRSREARTRDGHIVRYVDLADLNQMRRASARPKDLRRARELS